MKLVAVFLSLFALPLFAMTPDEFAETTQRVIAADGFAAYQPVAVFPARQEIRVLTGAPPDVTEAKIIEWAAKQAAGSEEFLVAFKVDSKHFKIVRSTGGQQIDSKVYEVR
jgi:hypothetical protein